MKRRFLFSGLVATVVGILGSKKVDASTNRVSRELFQWNPGYYQIKQADNDPMVFVNGRLLLEGSEYSLFGGYLQVLWNNLVWLDNKMAATVQVVYR